MDRLKPLKSLNLDLNLMENWKLWKQYFILFMAHTKYDQNLDNSY